MQAKNRFVIGEIIVSFPYGTELMIKYPVIHSNHVILVMIARVPILFYDKICTMYFISLKSKNTLFEFLSDILTHF